jgi:CRISPR-associated protein Cas1
VERPGGAVYLADEARRRVIVAYQERKKEEVLHRAVGRQMPFGLVPHVQARLLARHLRGELDVYIPYTSR